MLLIRGWRHPFGTVPTGPQARARQTRALGDHMTSCDARDVFHNKARLRSRCHPPVTIASRAQVVRRLCTYGRGSAAAYFRTRPSECRG
jgi:hypothetical protein